MQSTNLMQSLSNYKVWRLYLVTYLFNLYAEYIMRNAGLEEAQARIEIAGETLIISDTQMTLPL